jgi:hypothetical protein
MEHSTVLGEPTPLGSPDARGLDYAQRLTQKMQERRRLRVVTLHNWAHDDKDGVDDSVGIGREQLSNCREVTDQQMERLAIKRDKFHGEWNYTIRPKT